MPFGAFGAMWPPVVRLADPGITGGQRRGQLLHISGMLDRTAGGKQSSVGSLVPDADEHSPMPPPLAARGIPTCGTAWITSNPV